MRHSPTGSPCYTPVELRAWREGHHAKYEQDPGGEGLKSPMADPDHREKRITPGGRKWLNSSGRAQVHVCNGILRGVPEILLESMLPGIAGMLEQPAAQPGGHVVRQLGDY